MRCTFGSPSLLDDLGRVAVAVGAKGADHARCVRGGANPGWATGLPSEEPTLISTITGFSVSSRPARSGAMQRQVRGGGIAAHPADIAGGAHLLAVQLGQAVNEPAQPVRARW